MSTNIRTPGKGNDASTSEVTAHYGSSVPNSSNDAGATGRLTGFGFITSLSGILNIVIIVALVCVLICAGVSNPDDARQADARSDRTNVKVSALNTRNAVIAFAVIGLILILADTILNATGLINRLPDFFDRIFIIVMFVLAGVLLILGCCAAAWQKKMTDTYLLEQRKGSAGAASFFILVAMILIVVNFAFRLIRPTVRSESS